ncbi:MAG: DEAD/DEAH box helicase [Verrucomicrobiales bacterium]
MPSFQSLGLIPKLVQGVDDKGYTEPTPIQAKAIPAILEGRDVMGGAQTGTGKTAAFALPILQHLFQKRAKGREPRALVLTPTRELAAQVEESIFRYSKGLGIYSCAIYGGVKMPPQVAKLRRGVGVVVATPGRLLDHASGGTIDLSCIEVLVLDEADRMLDMGFMPDIRKIIDLMPKQRQNLMFSATYSNEIRSLAHEFLDKPMSIEVADRNAAAERVRQVVHPVERARKRELLSGLIADRDWEQVLVFARTRHGAEKLAQQLTKNGVDAVAIHGDKSQGQRTRALERFKRGAVRVLVATDVASRGLDIRQLPHVVNFEMPDVAEDYIHRIGRTGRAGEEGDAHSLVCRAEREKLAAVESLLRKKIPRREIEGFEGENIEFSGKPSSGGSRKGGSARGRNRGAGSRSSRPSSTTKSTSRTRDGNTARTRDGKPARTRDGNTARTRDGNTARTRDGKDTARTRDGNTARTRGGKDTARIRGGAVEDDKSSAVPTRPQKVSSTSAESRTKPRKGKPKWTTARKRTAKLKRAGMKKSGGRVAGRKSPRRA